MFKQCGWLFDARVVINLNQPRVSTLIKHEVISINFELELAIVWIQKLLYWFESQCDMRVYFLYGIIETERLIGHNFLKVRVWQLITFCNFSILPRELLNGVIGQVSKCVILIILHTVLHWGQSDIPFLEDIALQVMRDQDPYPHIKLSVHYEEGFLQILLDQEFIRLDQWRTLRLYPNVLVAIKELWLLSLTDLTVSGVTW